MTVLECPKCGGRYNIYGGPCKPFKWCYCGWSSKDLEQEFVDVVNKKFWELLA